MIEEKAKAAYRRVNEFTGGLLDILWSTIESFDEARAPEAAAGMAYYAIFSLFPLLLVLITLGSFFLESGEVYEQVMTFIDETFPTAQELIERNIQRVLEIRGTVSILALVGLLWSASGAFAILERNINLAWREAPQRDFVRSRLLALGMVGLLVVVLLLSLLVTTTVSLLLRLNIPLWGGVSVQEMPLWPLLSNLLPWLAEFLVFVSLYRWMPNTKVKWSAACWSAATAAFAWEAATRAFVWSLETGLRQYELVYGTLGTVLALLFWIYLTSWIALFGAHLSAAIEQHG